MLLSSSHTETIGFANSHKYKPCIIPDLKRMEHSAQPDKSKKYDRQLRIWGAHGQQALESTRICLLNCSPTGSETLKNLVLGGIASFTTVDQAVVEASDLGNNFFLESSHLGLSRAQHVTELLKELNEAVTGSYVQESPQELIENQPSFFKNFHLVIATQVALSFTSHSHFSQVYPDATDRT